MFTNARVRGLQKITMKSGFYRIQADMISYLTILLTEGRAAI
ncbi:hypothetical Protein YC6258_01475 [Gynuella sunshinyii YC6258]|uniref:Uncharacterized protein n=1 Tax=Gynuella sunshinyii YC6258 TaxID=1445510 RepID=A0A0C5VJE4_9GAMM|nr:hypothetical Protein YC6258_01475 [Gynuella sunshinyii YC6258]